jgi:hypothetical protein
MHKALRPNFSIHPLQKKNPNSNSLQSPDQLSVPSLAEWKIPTIFLSIYIGLLQHPELSIYPVLKNNLYDVN